MPSDSVLEEIRSRIDIVDLISEYVSLKQAGQNWKGLCPFHSEKTPSFTVSPSKQIYHCFGCSSGGDIFSFLVKYENLTFPEAVSILAKKAGVVLKEKRGEGTAQPGEKEVLLNMHRDADVFFRQGLQKSTKALEYLRKRGIDTDAAKPFSLGYAPKTWDSMLSYLTRKGYKPETLKRSGLVTQGQKGVYDTFRDRIMFPIHDLKGDVIAFGGRAIDGDEPKYLNSPETAIFNKRRVLYGLFQARDQIKKTGQVLFMEGYLDVITAYLHGFENAVAPLGTAFTPEHGKLIKRFVEDVVLVFDGDDAGIKAVKNAANILLESGLSVKVLAFPGGEDPDSYLRKYGKVSFRGLLDSPLSIIDFFMRQKGERRLLVREAIEAISKIPDSILQGYYVKTLSEQFRINEFFIIEQLRKGKGNVREQTASARPAKRDRKVSLDDIYIIKLLLQMPEKVPDAASFLSEGDFRDAAARSLFSRIIKGVNDYNSLLSRCEGDERELLTEITFREDFEDPETVFSDCVKRIMENRRRLQLQELQGKIREAETKKDFEALKALQKEHQELLRSGAKGKGI